MKNQDISLGKPHMILSEFFFMQPKVAIYVRVSTENQNHDSQEAELREYCSRRRWENVTWYSDTASGVKQNRQGFNELMQLVRKGKVDIILAFKLDRLARSLSHLSQVIAELQFHRVALICPSQGADTSNNNPAASLQINILAAVAEFERSLITDRVYSGIAAAKARGVVLGRPATPDKRRRQIADLVAGGIGATEISKRLKIPYSSVTEMIREIRAGALGR